MIRHSQVICIFFRYIFAAQSHTNAGIHLLEVKSMKKTIVYTCVLALLIAALAGCGVMRHDNDARPGTTAEPLIDSPAPGSGLVNDNDGIITDNDTGIVNLPDVDTDITTAPTPGATAQTGTANGRGNTASASPSASPAGNTNNNNNG